ncbi:MAG: NTP transferase domain-containing protein [Thermofilaceae archaeon]
MGAVLQSMPAVIVAAGVASRLHPYSRDLPKTLMELEPGLPLIRFILERLRKAGLGPIYVVTRREHAEKLGRELGARVLTVDREEFGNLYTVYTALKHVEPPFLIAMSDHIFEYELLERLLAHSSDKAFTICLDRTPSALEAREGLKVRIEEGRIVAVGKGLESRYGIDTGLIIVRERAVGYIEEAVARRGPQAAIGDALNLAAEAGDVDFVDVTGLLWKDVDTPEDLLEARRLYPRIILRERDKALPEPVTKLLVRPVSRILALGEPAHSRGEAVVKMALAELTLAALTVALAAFNLAAFLVLLAFSYASLLLSDARELLVELQGRTAALSALSTAASIFYDASLLSTVLLQLPEALSAPLLPLALLGLASAAGAEASRRLAAGGSLAWVLADRSLLLLALVFAQPTGWIQPILLLWLASGLAALAGSLRPTSRPGTRVAPHPQIEKRVRPTERCVELIVINGLKLFAALAVLWLAQAAVRGVKLNLGAAVLTAEDALSIAGLVVTIYYGYRILTGLRGLVDIYAVKLSSLLGITESSAKGLAMNALYLSIVVLALIYVPQLLREAPTLGSYISTAAALTLLLLALLLFYNLVKELRRTFKGFITLLASRAASVIEREG